jgi:hypothetical protein
MKNRITLIMVFLVSFVILGGCQSPCDLRGDWAVSGTFSYTGRPFVLDRAIFSNDSINLASGFYYAVADQSGNEDLQTGRHPYVYYGTKEKFKIIGDSLFLYSRPYSTWDVMKIVCKERDKVKLISKNEEWTLVRKQAVVMPPKRKYSIKYIKAHIYEDESVGLYGLNYTVTYSSDDKLFYQQESKKDSDHSLKSVQLKQGSFQEICNGFDYLDVTQLRTHYKAPESDARIIDLEIGLNDGRVIKSQIEDVEYPDELKLALIPVIFGYMKALYPDLKPLR